jgi:hypothetical protein
MATSEVTGRDRVLYFMADKRVKNFKIFDGRGQRCLVCDRTITTPAIAIALGAGVDVDIDCFRDCLELIMSPAVPVRKPLSA